MLVHDIARKSGFSAYTIRYYARIGLLRPSKDPDNGYQRFDRNDVERLDFVREARALGLTLTETRDLLAGRDGQVSCEQVVSLLTSRLSETRAQVETLRRREERILSALGGCTNGHCCLPFDFPCRRANCLRAAPDVALDLTAADRSSNGKQEGKAGHSMRPLIRKEDRELEYV